MKRRVSVLNAAFLSATSLGLSLMPNAAFATPLIEDNLSTCNTVRCESVSVTGTYLAPTISGVFKPNPAVYQVYASGNECLRIEGTAQSTDVEIELISPRGTVWRDDDGAGDTRPLLKARTTDNGWYTLHVARYDGGTPEGTFTLSIGRYNNPTTNVNCSAPSSPVYTSPNSPK
jgi:hypothetical protein